MSDFIGRAEPPTHHFLLKLYPDDRILTQTPLSYLISHKEFQTFNEEVQKHKFDFVVIRNNKPTLVIEVNYKHGEKSAKKWRQIFEPLLKKEGYIPVTIDDYDCISLFKGNKENHKLSWNDLRDIINALEKAGVEP